MHRTIRVGEMSVTFIKTRHETGGTFDLFELTIPPLARLPLPHIHRKYDETIFGVDGTMTWTILDKPMVVRKGVTLFIPRNTPHSYANTTHSTARILCLQTPGVLGPEYYHEIAACFDAGHPDLAHMGAVMSRHGVIPITQTEQAAATPPKGIAEIKPSRLT